MKTKLAVFAVIAGVVAVGSILAAQAQVATLTVSCTGAVSGNQIAWSATTTGGNAPYAFLWSGDPSVSGQTSGGFVESYTTNGTYTAGIQATDASSSVATSTCSATVTANVPPATTSTLNVILSVNNAAGGSATASNFPVTVNGANASPSSFGGSSTGTAVVVSGGSTYSVSASSLTNYSESESGNCAGPIAAGAADACTITEAYVSPTISTTTLPRVNPPTLSIGANGSFLSRGMTVTSVSSDSFQAQVWGITYTVNWSGNLYPQFYFRYGNNATSTTNPSEQLKVGDEVGVSGTVTSGSPLVVTANVVRDYSITMPRTPFLWGILGNGRGEGNGNGNENFGGTIGTLQNLLNATSPNNASPALFNQRIQDLYNQLRGLQNLFHIGGNNGNGSGNGNGNGGQ